MPILALLLSTVIGAIIKITCCKVLIKKYGDKSVKYLTIISFLLSGFAFYYILGMYPKGILFLISGGFTTSFLTGGVNTKSSVHDKH